jgi:hypothetical protein
VGQGQVHDFNPGISLDGTTYSQNGVFWTIPFSASNVAINIDQATASMSATNLPMPDYSNIINSLGFNGIPPSFVQGQVSFAMSWTGVGRPTQIRDQTNGFAGLFIDSRATISWSASEPGFQYVSDADVTAQTQVSGVIGKERNGKFFPQGS